MKISKRLSKNFIEPTLKYVEYITGGEQWKYASPKEWFNGDLMYWAFCYKFEKEENMDMLNVAYKEFCDAYDVELSTEELIMFQKYSEKDYHKVVKYLLDTNTNQKS